MRIHSLVAALALPGCLVQSLVDQTDHECFVHKEGMYLAADDGSPQMAFLLGNCRADVDACVDLCAHVLAAHGVEESPERCEVAFFGDTAAVRVDWQHENFDGGCAVPVSAGDDAIGGDTR